MPSNRKVHGVGVNDTSGYVSSKVNGKKVFCPYYDRWKGMLRRCYSASEHKRSPSYIGCSVCDEWLLFSNFKKWMATQDWQGKQLDKDLLVQGNKIYSPECCLFVSKAINSLLTGDRSNKGDNPQGVSFNKCAKEYIANVFTKGKQVYIGSFCTSDLAFEAYKTAKYAIIKNAAMEQSDPLKSALLRYKIK